MILFVNAKGEIKDVGSTDNQSLTRLDISDNNNPIASWPVAKICCYRVGVIPETVTEVTGTENYTYTDEEGNEITETRDIVETKETGKYLITMMTPYMDSRIVEHVAKLGSKDEIIESDLTDTQIGLIENYNQTMAIESDLVDTQLGLVENYDLAMTAVEDVTVAQQEITDVQMALVEIYNLVMGGE